MLKERINTIVKESTHMIIIGSRGEGKTGLGFYLLELHKEAGRKVFIYNHPKPELLPEWINNITKLEDLPVGATVLIDESSNDFDQYSYNKRTNIYLRDILRRARHKNQSFIFIVLTTTFINLNFLYMIDSWFFKQPTMFQRESERKVVRWAYMRIQEEIKINEFYYMDKKEWCKACFIKPEWFTEELSNAYSSISAEMI